MIPHRPLSVILLTLIFTFTETSFAACCSMLTCGYSNCLYEGIYVGGGLGYDFFSTDQTIRLISQNGNPIFTRNQTLSTSGPLARGVFGYGQYYDWFYFAGEIFTSYADAKSSHTIPGYQTDMDVHWGYGLGLLPGVRLSHSVLLYSRIDYLRTYMKTREITALAGEFTKWDGNTGFDLGIGFETSLFPYANRFPFLSLRGEYTHAHYGSSESLLKTNFDTRNNQFIFEVLYHFCNP